MYNKFNIYNVEWWRKINIIIVLLYSDKRLVFSSGEYKAHNYTAKLLIHQSPPRHSDWSVTEQSLLLTAGSMVTTQLMNFVVTLLQAVVTVQSLCIVGDWWNRSFVAYRLKKGLLLDHCVYLLSDIRWVQPLSRTWKPHSVFPGASSYANNNDLPEFYQTL